MKKPICYMHVGMGKTGSSAIQYALMNAQDHLLKCGFLYPDVSNNFKRALRLRTTAGNGGKLHRLIRKGSSDKINKLLKPYSVKAKHLILSCEGFSTLRPAYVRELQNALDSLGYDTRCLIYFRPQSEMLVSRYLQMVKGNNIRGISLAEYVAGEVEHHTFDSKWNWCVFMDKLSENFGENNITVKWYPAVTRPDGPGVIQATLDWLGVELNEELLAERKTIINPTPGRESLAVLERINASGLYTPTFTGNFLIEAQKHGLLGSRVWLSPDLRDLVDSATRSSNTTLLKRFCPELSVEDELRPINDPLQDEELDKDTIAELVKIAEGMCRNSFVNR